MQVVRDVEMCRYMLIHTEPHRIDMRCECACNNRCCLRDVRKRDVEFWAISLGTGRSQARRRQWYLCDYVTGRKSEHETYLDKQNRWTTI